MRARYYSPELRRFLNSDPAGFDGGMNWYAYANNSPLMYVDPDGEVPVLAAVAIGFAVGASADVASQMLLEGRSWSEVNLTRTLAAGALGAVGGGGISAVRSVGIPGIRSGIRSGFNHANYGVFRANQAIASQTGQRIVKVGGYGSFGAGFANEAFNLGIPVGGLGDVDYGRSPIGAAISTSLTVFSLGEFSGMAVKATPSAFRSTSQALGKFSNAIESSGSGRGFK